MAPQPSQGTQICWGNYQLGICRLRSLNKAVLTRTVQTPALTLLLQTQSFSNQHPGFCSCARAHSKYPHPIPDGAEHCSWLIPYLKTQPEAIHSQLLLQSNSSPSSIRNVTHQIPPPEDNSAHMELPPCADSAPVYKTVLTVSKPHSYREQDQKLERLWQPQDHLISLNYLPWVLYCHSTATQRCNITVVQQCPNTGINGLVLSSCLKSWGASIKGLHQHSIIGHTQDFGYGRVPPAQRPQTPELLESK